MTGAEHAWAPRIGLAPVPGALLASFPDAAVRERLMVLLQGPDKDLHILAAEALITGAGRDVPQSVLLAALASPVKSAWYVALLRLEQNKAVPDRAFLEPLRRVAQTGELYADCLPLLLRMGDTATVLRSCERLLKHEYSKVSCQAVSILAGAGEGAFETLFKHVADRRSDVREAAARALGDQIDHPRVLAFVEGALKSDDSVLRQGAQAVLKTANRGVAPPMARQAQLREAILADREGWRDLHRKVDAAAVQLARDLLRDNEANVRAAVAQMLGEASDDTAVAALKEALIDRSPLVRSQAIVSLGKLGHRSAAASILPLLTDVDPAVCEAAAIALGRLGDPAAVEPLVTVLGNLDWRQRRAAAQALGMLRAPRACQPLRGALAGDPHWQVRAVAATALGHVGDRSAAAALIAAVDDEHWRVRQAGAEALQSLTGQKFGVDVRAWEAWCRAQPGPATTRKGQ
jgi:HEAT repeat protein